MSPALTTVQFAEHLWWIFVGQHLGNLRARASDA
jgi:hypothetical protein